MKRLLTAVFVFILTAVSSVGYAVPCKMSQISQATQAVLPCHGEMGTMSAAEKSACDMMLLSECFHIDHTALPSASNSSPDAGEHLKMFPNMLTLLPENTFITKHFSIRAPPEKEGLETVSYQTIYLTTQRLRL